MTGKSVRAAAVFASLVLAVAACSGDGGQAPGGASADPIATTAPGEVPGPLEEAVTVRFGVFSNVTHAPGLVELAEGGQLARLLPNADIPVSWFNSGTTAVEAMFSDAIDVTFIGPNPAINAYAQSNGEAVRLLRQRAVRRDGVVLDAGTEVALATGEAFVLSVGAARHVRIEGA